jgi:hypothetical protein
MSLAIGAVLAVLCCRPRRKYDDEARRFVRVISNAVYS